jgi:hypothetical protein
MIERRREQLPTDVWARTRRAATELSAEAIEQIAQRVAEVLRGDSPPPAGNDRCLLDAAGLAQRLGVNRDWVYAHAAELGAIVLGHGPRARLRFDPDVAIQMLTARTRVAASEDPSPAPSRRPPRRRRDSSTGGVPLLPVYEPRARGICPRFAAARQSWR